MNQIRNYSEKYLQNSKIGCILMASGQSIRFGSNKLLAEFKGKPLYQWIFELTDCDLFDRRVVVTRTKEVYEQALEQGMEAVLHDYPDRNDAVRLGVKSMKDMDACMFIPCDQPLLTQVSLHKLIFAYKKYRNPIVRLAWEDCPGSPIIFDRSLFEELCKLPKKKGGSYVAAQHSEEILYVQAEDANELRDIDTKEDLEKMQVE